MGFIPVILNMSAAILLFILAVHNSLKSKKSQMEELRFSMEEGIKALTKDLSGMNMKDTDELSEIFHTAKSALEESHQEAFHLKVRKPYQQIKLLKSQYNQLIARKPYSFVAKIMGHQPI